MDMLLDPQTWITLVTLSAIEIVLGIDNLVFISIAVSKLPAAARDRARRFGIAVACVTRIALLLTLAWLAGLTDPLFSLLGHDVSVRDLVLIVGGLFLVVKGSGEIRDLIVGEAEEEDMHTRPVASFGMVIAQIAIIDIVFSLDSVIAAVGMANQKVVMVGAILLAVAVMLLASKPLGRFIDENPTIKMLALAFIVLVGVFLVVEGFDVHVSKGYIYGAMAFSATVELLNTAARRRAARRQLEP
ncbi:TerC family protein [Cognatilysobacter lacus]|uniref:TerC family protein n=1 Tax=Cognatilysobacter lacus TaxID=1643323 RepID=A0A5D8YVF5_9GAMM|nr:TerC family protein [Lysobacter lacus]TZF86685.1 TerC family protein [Lysobacter lacus]